MNQRLAIIILLWQLTGIYGKLELSSDKGGKGLGEWVVTETEKIRRGWRASANFFFVASWKLSRLPKLNIAILVRPGLGNRSEMEQ